MMHCELLGSLMPTRFSACRRFKKVKEYRNSSCSIIHSRFLLVIVSNCDTRSVRVVVCTSYVGNVANVPRWSLLVTIHE